MLFHLAHAVAFSSLFYFASASPTDPSKTTSSAAATVTGKAIVNGTVHEVKIAEKLAVNPSATSMSSSVRPLPTSSPGNRKEASISMNPPAQDDDLYTINYKTSDFGGSTYCNSRYKSFWYNDWITDPTKRAASCDAVAYNRPNQLNDWGYTNMENGDIFWGPEKDGTNVCYWHFTCEYEEEVASDVYAEGPLITFKNVQNIAKAWYDPANWPKGKSPKACGHIMLDRANSLNQCKLTISIIPQLTGVLSW